MVSSHPLHFLFDLILARTRSKWRCEIEFIISGMSILLFQKGKNPMFEPPMIAIKTVVLSEAQSYGMLITVAAAKKGQAQQADFDRLYQYYLNHRLKGTQLMSWKQTIANGEARC